MSFDHTYIPYIFILSFMLVAIFLVEISEHAEKKKKN